MTYRLNLMHSHADSPWYNKCADAGWPEWFFVTMALLLDISPSLEMGWLKVFIMSDSSNIS